MYLMADMVVESTVSGPFRKAAERNSFAPAAGRHTLSSFRLPAFPPACPSPVFS